MNKWSICMCKLWMNSNPLKEKEKEAVQYMNLDPLKDAQRLKRA